MSSRPLTAPGTTLTVCRFCRELAKLRDDLGIVERLVAIEDVEADYREDLAEMTMRISTLRINLAELRENKTVLTVEYREGLAP